MSFSALLTTFANNILPILLMSGGGFIVGKTMSIDVRSVGRIVFFLFSPVLVFNILVHSQLPIGDILQTAGFAAAIMFSTGLLAFLGGTLFSLERPALVAVIVTAMFGNNGNYGLPLISFAFGPQALAHSSIYFVTSAILINTVGVLIASLGHMNLKQAILGLLKVPTMYAVVLALLVVRSGITLPTPLDRSVTIVAGGAIPMMLFLLGLELQRARWSQNLRALTLSSSLRLLIGPLLGFAYASFFGMSGTARQASITEAAMPSAVFNTVLASEYNLDSSLVTAIILISTLLSPLTLTPLLVFLGK
jgi:hypothetical protein